MRFWSLAFPKSKPMIRNILLAGLYVSYVFMLVAAGWTAYSAACEYRGKNEELTDRLHAKPKVKNLLKRAGEIITLGLYNGYSEEIKEINRTIRAIQNYKQRTVQATIAFFLISGVFLISVYWLVSNEAFFIGAMLIISTIALGVGLFAPILTIVTYKDIPVLGEVVFLFQSKGIITTIETLFNSRNIIVAIPLSLFSVLIPFLKTIAMGIALPGPDHPLAARSLKLIRRIGKWSMADVFVVTLLLTYFTVNKENTTSAEVQIGLYFFLGYVILSMIASTMLVRGET